MNACALVSLMADDAVVDGRFTTEITEQATEIKNEEEVGELSRWDRIVDIFLANNIANLRTVDVNHVMIHPENRNRSGLN